MNKKHNFDEQIKHKLDGLHTSPLYGSWESFRQKLDVDTGIPEISDDDFDARVHHKIQKFQPACKSAHWEKLRYKLETIELFRRKILLHKAKELVAVLLFLFTFYNVTIHQKDWMGGQSKMYVSAPQGQKSKMANDHKLNAKNQDFQLAMNAKVSLNNPGNLDAGKSTNNSASESRAVRISPLVLPFEAVQIAEETKANTRAENLHVISSTFSKDIQHENLNEMAEVSSLSNPIPETYSLYATIIPMNLGKKSSAQNVNRFGIQVAQVDNFILSPFDKVYSVPRFSNSTRNQSYGITYGKKRNRWELETGLAYSRLSYKPAEVREIYGNTGEISFETSLQKIQFDIWKLPVGVKYFFVDKKSWKYYTVLGSSLNVISEADYSIEENIILSRPFAPVQYTQDGPRLEEKPFTNGLFNDGKLEGNFYVDVFLGMGVEMSVSKFASVYLQPAYHAFLFSEGIGIGPNNDKINAFQLQTGVKFHFAD